jgi:hypothetical protein
MNNHLSKRNYTVAILWMLLLAVLLTGCAEDEQPAIDQVITPPSFSVVLEVNAAQETHGSLVVTNPSEDIFPADDDFNAEMNLYDQAAQPRAKVEAHVIQEIQPGESIYLSSGRWKLDPGVYFLTWGAPEYGGSVTVFSVIEESGRLYLGKSQSFPTKPVQQPAAAARAGSITSFRLDDEGTLTLQGKTQMPDGSHLFVLLYAHDGLLEGFPTGSWIQAKQGEWQLQIPSDPAGAKITIEPDSFYRAVLLTEDLTVPPSEPFVIEISPPQQP